MTVAKLHKLLAAEIANGNGRVPVCIDKPTFRHNLEPDGAVILDLEGLRVEDVPQVDDDGGMKIDSRGRECHRTCLVLHGSAYEPERADGGSL